MSEAYALVERDGPLTIVTLNRPQMRNALSAQAHHQLNDIFDDFAADDSQWIAIITGAGKAFCAGHDLKRQESGGGLETPSGGFAGLTTRFDLVKPVIAAVNGAAVGGGFEAALACDLIIAAEEALFGLPEPRIGLAALAGGIQRLTREIGMKQAMGMLLTGRLVSAQEGFELGFVNEVVQGDVLAAAKGWAARILACSPLSVRATKEAALRAMTVSVEEGLRSMWHYPAIVAMLQSEDAIEGPRAFVEKRAPAWRGR
jgi:enoyl-CoA hydratase/carnithine racemase